MRSSRFFAAALTASLALELCGCSSVFGRNSKDIKEFTAYFEMTGEELPDGNEIQQVIAEKTGALCHEKWRDPNKSEAETIEEMIIARKYPDFIYGGMGQQALVDADALVPINQFWDGYENIQNYFTPEEWDRLKDENGYIHYIPVFSKTYMHETDPEYSGEAFWIQAKVLEWGGYPDLKTPDQYFDLIERYLKEHPENENGDRNIGYEILADGYLYFCMENPPQFLDGYPNDGSCIVNPQTLTAVDYNVTPTAEKWFKKLNEEYHKGVIDPDFAFMSSAQYSEKIKSGTVLGMVDQRWNFRAAENELPADCKYIPFDLVADESITPNYASPRAMDTSQGLGISVDCDDIEAALKFIDDLLSPEILNLRFWGIEGQDYYRDESGLFYRDDKQKSRSFNKEYVDSHFCRYGYFPYYSGMNQDGKNTYRPENQPEEFSSTVGGPVKKCLEAYGAATPGELIHEAAENGPWFPMWSYTNTFTEDTKYGRAKAAIDQVKHRYLPEVIMSDDFEKSWEEYMEAYRSCDINVYFDELTSEIRRRAGR
ncbi:extracellular solute-binding protein [Ruminococcus sp. HUN007]|uniref:extracellular solute-binding protein n=1 Tax=Ruminococcus sp. HUN007 TaxID=1514668 RepID=UPI0005D19DE6|nr:extracellular solute-binding protein [Ruminococcus sp. HUN007]